MLASIHPLGERARGNRWSRTVSAYVAGSAVGGVLTGALAAAAGWVARAVSSPPPALPASLAAAAAVVAAAWDLHGAGALPPRRQVNEDWLAAYRGWVYGAGFGVQLGAGLATMVTTATVPLTFLLAFLSGVAGAPLAGATAGLVFGVSRAAPALLLRGVHDPDRLRRFHERMHAASGRARLTAAGGAALAGGLALLSTVAAWP